MLAANTANAQILQMVPETLVPFLFHPDNSQHAQTQVHKERGFSQFAMEELDWPAQDLT